MPCALSSARSISYACPVESERDGLAFTLAVLDAGEGRRCSGSTVWSCSPPAKFKGTVALVRAFYPSVHPVEPAASPPDTFPMMEPTPSVPQVLFVGVHKAGRSQMAAALLSLLEALGRPPTMSVTKRPRPHAVFARRRTKSSSSWPLPPRRPG